MCWNVSSCAILVVCIVKSYIVEVNTQLITQSEHEQFLFLPRESIYRLHPSHIKIRLPMPYADKKTMI